jgi:hypothetical protein
MKPDTTATTRTRPTHASARSFMRRHGFGYFLIPWHERTIRRALTGLDWRVTTVERIDPQAVWTINAYAEAKPDASKPQLKRMIRKRMKECGMLLETLEIGAGTSGKRIQLSLISRRDPPGRLTLEQILAEGVPED